MGKSLKYLKKHCKSRTVYSAEISSKKNEGKINFFLKEKQKPRKSPWAEMQSITV